MLTSSRSLAITVLYYVMSEVPDFSGKQKKNVLHKNRALPLDSLFDTRILPSFLWPGAQILLLQRHIKITESFVATQWPGHLVINCKRTNINSRINAKNFCTFTFSTGKEPISKSFGIFRGKIPNKDMKASSEVDKYHAAYLARLNLQPKGRFKGGWSAKRNNRKQWIQVDFRRFRRLTKVAIQGRANAKQYVTI